MTNCSNSRRGMPTTSFLAVWMVLLADRACCHAQQMVVLVDDCITNNTDNLLLFELDFSITKEDFQTFVVGRNPKFSWSLRENHKILYEETYNQFEDIQPVSMCLDATAATSSSCLVFTVDHVKPQDEEGQRGFQVRWNGETVSTYETFALSHNATVSTVELNSDQCIPTCEPGQALLEVAAWTADGSGASIDWQLIKDDDDDGDGVDIHELVAECPRFNNTPFCDYTSYQQYRHRMCLPAFGSCHRLILADEYGLDDQAYYDLPRFHISYQGRDQFISDFKFESIELGGCKSCNHVEFFAWREKHQEEQIPELSYNLQNRRPSSTAPEETILLTGSLNRENSLRRLHYARTCVDEGTAPCLNFVFQVGDGDSVVVPDDYTETVPYRLTYHDVIVLDKDHVFSGWTENTDDTMTEFAMLGSGCTHDDCGDDSFLLNMEITTGSKQHHVQWEVYSMNTDDDKNVVLTGSDRFDAYKPEHVYQAFTCLDSDDPSAPCWELAVDPRFANDDDASKTASYKVTLDANVLEDRQICEDGICDDKPIITALNCDTTGSDKLGMGVIAGIAVGGTLGLLLLLLAMYKLWCGSKRAQTTVPDVSSQVQENAGLT